MIARFKGNIHSVADMRLFLRIAAWIHLIVLMLKVMSFPRILALLTPGRPEAIRGAEQEALIGKVCAYTDFILGRNRWIYSMNCLKRSLVMYRMLRCHGVDVRFCMGVRRSVPAAAAGGEPTLQGHAWLKLDGRPVLEDRRSSLVTYAPVFSFPEEDGAELVKTV